MIEDPLTNHSESTLVQYRGKDVRVLEVVMFSSCLGLGCTGNLDFEREWDGHHSETRTDSGVAWDQGQPLSEQEGQTTRKAVSELRRLSGLTWDQLGRLLGVSRRSVHHWASGKPMNAQNEQRLMRVLGVVRHAYRGSASATRQALLSASSQGAPFDLLVEERFDDARIQLGRGVEPGPMTYSRLGTEARDARKPLPPNVLVEGVSEQVGRDPGRARGARSARVRRRDKS